MQDHWTNVVRQRSVRGTTFCGVPHDERTTPGPSGHTFTRRAALAGAGLGLGWVAGSQLGHDASGSATASVAPVPFEGRHQAGVATAPQRYAQVTAFDVVTPGISELRDLLQTWSNAARALTRGRALAGDPGEAVGLSASGLTLTFGVGPSLFEHPELASLVPRRPRALTDLPSFPGDALEPRWSAGDICVQACADDQQVAFHAVHMLAMAGAATVAPRWSQQGFRGGFRAGESHRNLFGFKEGTRNVRPDEPTEMARHVWVADADAPLWMVDGTYMVVRRIRMLFDVWDTTTVDEQERVIGRHKRNGAPLGGHDEHDDPDLLAAGASGPTIPDDAHIRLAAPQRNGGARLLRRGYSYSGAVDETGQTDAGLLFICFQRDPSQQFVPIQQRLSQADALGKHIVHTGSAVFACPPGARRGGYVGEGLFTGP